MGQRDGSVGKLLAAKEEDLSLDFQHLCKKSGEASGACNLSARKAEAGNARSLLVSLGNSVSPASVKDPVSNNKVERYGRKHPWHPCACMHAHTHTHTHIYVYVTQRYTHSVYTYTRICVSTIAEIAPILDHFYLRSHIPFWILFLSLPFSRVPWGRTKNFPQRITWYIFFFIIFL